MFFSMLRENHSWLFLCFDMHENTPSQPLGSFFSWQCRSSAMTLCQQRGNFTASRLLSTFVAVAFHGIACVEICGVNGKGVSIKK